jgi:hypothetical protein
MTVNEVDNRICTPVNMLCMCDSLVWPNEVTKVFT